MTSFSAYSGAGCPGEDKRTGAERGSSYVGADGELACAQVQVDLSAMLDGELDPDSVRRVLVHSDLCSACSGFLDGIRTQLRAHRDLAEAGIDADGVAGLGANVGESPRCKAIREQLMQNRRQLAQILYELGRGYVLLGTSPNFSREVAQEPVPIPDMEMSGRNLLDEVARLASGSIGVEWARAKALFGDGDTRSPVQNVRKGKRLLAEALIVEPEFHEARIYLGHAHHLGRELEAARREFRVVLDSAADPITRAFALENLGNVYLEEGRPALATPCFLELVDSGVIGREPRFFTSYFNLAFAFVLLMEFGECQTWLARLHEEFPHKRRLVGLELASRDQLVEIFNGHPDVEASFARAFPEWFPFVTEAV